VEDNTNKAVKLDVCFSIDFESLLLIAQREVLHHSSFSGLFYLVKVDKHIHLMKDIFCGHADINFF
jgi:hypothetical protein